MKKLGLLLIIVFFIFLLSVANAVVGVTCFEGDFVRDKAKPITETKTFPGIEGQATIKVFNGGKAGKGTKQVM